MYKGVVFGLFKKKFQASKHLKIHAWLDGEEITDARSLPPETLVRLVSSGLHAYERLEIEIVDAPLALVQAAASLINLVAEYHANTKEIGDGESFGHGLSRVYVTVRAFRVDADGQTVLRLVDLDCKEPNGAPGMAISTLAFLRGITLVESDQTAALVNWLGAAKFFPARGSFEGFRWHEDHVLNDGNILNYLALAEHDEGRAESYYSMLLYRFRDMMRLELGVHEVPSLDIERAADAVRALLAALLDDELAAAWGPERMVLPDDAKGADLMAMLPSPIVVRDGSTCVQEVSILPFPLRRYFYESPVREQLRSDEVVNLTAEVVGAAATNLGRVLAPTLDTRNLYCAQQFGPGLLLGDPEGDSSFARNFALEGDELPVVSRVLADIGRRLAGETSLDELRAVYGLTEDAEREASAKAKLEALRDAEGELMMRAIGV